MTASDVRRTFILDIGRGAQPSSEPQPTSDGGVIPENLHQSPRIKILLEPRPRPIDSFSVSTVPAPTCDTLLYDPRELFHFSAGAYMKVMCHGSLTALLVQYAATRVFPHLISFIRISYFSSIPRYDLKILTTVVRYPIRMGEVIPRRCQGVYYLWTTGLREWASEIM